MDKFRLWRPATSFLPESFSIKSDSMADSQIDQDPAPKTLNHRSISLHPGFISNANGSCYIEQGNTKVIATVHGPFASTMTKKSKYEAGSDVMTTCLIETFYKNASFSKNTRTEPGPQTKEELICSKLLHEAIYPIIQVHKYPKMKINVSIVVIEDDGSALAASVNAASLALANAGLQMYDFVAAVGFDLKDEQIKVDPSGEGLPDATLAYLPSIGQISLFEVTKSVDDKKVDQLLEMTQKLTQDIYAKQISAI